MGEEDGESFALLLTLIIIVTSFCLMAVASCTGNKDILESQISLTLLFYAVSWSSWFLQSAYIGLWILEVCSEIRMPLLSVLVTCAGALAAIFIPIMLLTLIPYCSAEKAAEGFIRLIGKMHARSLISKPVDEKVAEEIVLIDRGLWALTSWWARHSLPT